MHLQEHVDSNETVLYNVSLFTIYFNVHYLLDYICNYNRFIILCFMTHFSYRANALAESELNYVAH